MLRTYINSLQKSHGCLIQRDTFTPSFITSIRCRVGTTSNGRFQMNIHQATCLRGTIFARTVFLHGRISIVVVQSNLRTHLLSTFKYYALKEWASITTIESQKVNASLRRK